MPRRFVLVVCLLAVTVSCGSDSGREQANRGSGASSTTAPEIVWPSADIEVKVEPTSEDDYNRLSTLILDPRSPLVASGLRVQTMSYSAPDGDRRFHVFYLFLGGGPVEPDARLRLADDLSEYLGGASVDFDVIPSGGIVPS